MLVEPVHPDKLNITLAAVWVSLCTLVFGLPVAFASWLAASGDPDLDRRSVLVVGGHRPRIMSGVTVIKINAITVPADSGDELAQRFAARAGAVDDQEGFEGFELLKPTDDRSTWLVVTRWRDEESFQAWVSSAGLRRTATRAPTGRPRTVGPVLGVVGAVELRGGEVAETGGSGRAGRAEPARRVTLRHLHDVWAWFVVIGNGVAGLWALGAHWLGAAAQPGAVVVHRRSAEIAIFVQVGLGVRAVAARGHRRPQFHMFYGFVA